MTLIAIDPGKSGGIAWTEPSGESFCVPMPQTDGDILDFLRSAFARGQRDCHIEHVCGFVGGAGAGQMFEFGKGFGFLLGCLMTIGIRHPPPPTAEMAEGPIPRQQERSWQELEEPPEK